jgi:hypothetical protein
LTKPVPADRELVGAVVDGQARTVLEDARSRDLEPAVDPGARRRPGIVATLPALMTKEV